MLVPKHLGKILRVDEYDDRGTLSGKIVCECGCETFGIKYFGEVFRPGCIGMGKYSEKYAHIVKAVCRGCCKTWELYNFAKHGYDGLICEDGISVPEEELIDVTANGECNFEVKMSIEFDDEEQFTEEIVKNPPDGMNFSPDDRVNIWSWIVIDLKCAGSGKELNGFIDSELS